MHRFNGYDIELTRGDSLFFKIDLTGRDLPEGSVAYFSVKTSPKATDYVIRKKLNASDELLDVRLMPEDTDISARTYFWDVRVLIPLETGGYEVETPMEYASLTILDAIGSAGDDGEPPGMDADLPVLSILITQVRELIDELENFEIPDEKIEQFVNEYLDENPPAYKGITEDQLAEAVENALREAKESGEFDGDDGKDGLSVTVVGVTESEADGGSNVITFSDGSKLVIKNGKTGGVGRNGMDGVGIASAVLNTDYTLTLNFTDGTKYTTPSIRGAAGADGRDGKDGSAGEPGYTPVRGTDYWTPSDKAEVVQDVLQSMPEAEEVTLESIVNALGYVPAPVINSSATGGVVTDAVGGLVASVIADLDPITADGSKAPSYNGGSFASYMGRLINVKVNGKAYAVTVQGDAYAGSYDFVTGQLISTAYVVGISGYVIADEDVGTNSAGVNYVYIQSSAFGGAAADTMLACNRYIRKDEYPYVDKSVRVRNDGVYIYDNAIDLNNPQAILNGLEFLFPLSSPVVSDGGETQPQISFVRGENTITSDAGEVTVSYAVDTKTYIDQKFAALSAAIVGG